MEKKSIAGKAESKRWRREATLKDILDALDQIDASDRAPEEKAKLRQRVIDYAQNLSKEIYEGKRKVPESDDNDTIKKFNLRIYSTYYTKGESSYEEASCPAGYYDKKGKFIRGPYEYKSAHVQGAKNPRWHPIPLREEVLPPPPPPPPPVIEDDGRQGGGAGGAGGTGNTGGAGGTGNTGGAGGAGNTGGAGGTGNTGGAGGTGNTGGAGGNSSGTSAMEKTASNSNKKRRISPLWFIPLALASAGAGTVLLKDKSSDIPPEGSGEKDKTELVTPPQFTPSELDHMRYTVDTGQRRMAKQLNVSVEEGAEIYNQFVDNIRKGNIPETMKKFAEDFNMSKMVNEDLDFNLDRPEIEATTWLLISESYDDVRPIILNAILNPQQEISSADAARINRRLTMAQAAAEKHGVDLKSDYNLVSRDDYGLYGASKRTGPSVSFRKAKREMDKADYGKVVLNAFNKPGGKDY